MAVTNQVALIDVGTSSIRAAVVSTKGTMTAWRARATLPDSPGPGLVQFDPHSLIEVAKSLLEEVLAESGSVDGLGISNQRASTVVWDRETGEAVAPGLGWQDLRTIGSTLTLAAEGIKLAPNLSATKIVDIWDRVDPTRSRDLCVGTIDSWLIWHLTNGATHVTDPSNAALTGLLDPAGVSWSTSLCERLDIPIDSLPRIVDSSGSIAAATSITGAPTIAGVLGDQQASLVGQGCFEPGQAKATFGTGGMLDMVIGDTPPNFATRGPGGAFPIIARSIQGHLTWGVEAAMLSAGTCVEWLRDDLGLIAEVEESAIIAAQCETTDDVWFVPALLGLGAPKWDYGARGTLLGITRGTGRQEIVRAVLTGVAQRGADLLEAAESDGQHQIEALRIDGGMSDNPVFVQSLANACQRPIEVSPQREATALGAAFMAGLAVDTWANTAELAAIWQPKAVVEPAGPSERERWADAVGRSTSWIPELSGLDF